MSGTLTGQSFKQNDTSLRVVDEWGHFYPLDKISGSLGDHNVVEVIVAGVKMRYPACYVLVTDMDDSLNNSILNNCLQQLANGIKNGTSM